MCNVRMSHRNGRNDRNRNCNLKYRFYNVCTGTLSFSIFSFNHWSMGSKDNLYPLEKLDVTRKKMKSRNELHVIYRSDHSFKIAKKHLQAIGST
ncbi:hypothetical protein Lal_00026787 [Lupinus albus]|nr:hypothetical protein Lal_00026787 [Lupinus albus]